ncbi:MAG: hypothetical protein AAGH15_01315 [Myxococcota bacterium]
MGGSTWSDALRDAFRLVTFRLEGEAQRGLGRRHLAIGLTATWLVGMGRWWDDPDAIPLQKLGVGSLVYVVGLAVVLHLVIAPAIGRRFRWGSMLAFVTLTSPPAAFYAIPVERFMATETAAMVNVIFLIVVATWRVALLVRFLRVGWEQSRWDTAVLVLFPLSAIVSALSLGGAAELVFQGMSGLRDPSAAEAISNAVVRTLACAGPLVFLLSFAWYLDVMREARREQDEPGPRTDEG